MTPYWHVQRLFLTELTPSLARGLAPGVGVALAAPIRMVRDRIRFEDLAREPYLPPSPDTHHRNETLANLGDPTLALLFARPATPWTLNASLGATLPVGRTEDNPFQRGRLGLPHQHIQFGTGTWDPKVAVAASRAFGKIGFAASAAARLTLYENVRGFRAGNRYSFALDAARRVRPTWGASTGLLLAREEAEKWNGAIEQQGNLGRTDLFLALGVDRAFAPLGTLALRAQVPLASRAVGEQVKFPIVLALNLAH